MFATRLHHPDIPAHQRCRVSVHGHNVERWKLHPSLIEFVGDEDKPKRGRAKPAAGTEATGEATEAIAEATDTPESD